MVTKRSKLYPVPVASSSSLSRPAIRASDGILDVILKDLPPFLLHVSRMVTRQVDSYDAHNCRYALNLPIAKTEHLGLDDLMQNGLNTLAMLERSLATHSPTHSNPVAYLAQITRDTVLDCNLR